MNMVGSLEDRSFVFNGVVLPRSPSKLEEAICEVFDLVTGKIPDTLAKSMSMVYHVNNKVAVLGDELSFVSASRLNEHILRIYIAKSTTHIGDIYLNARGLRPTIVGYAGSIKGLREGKERNDDSIAVLSMSYCYGDTVRKIHIGVVADGVTSLGRGYYVSSEAIKIFTSKLLRYVYAVQDLTPGAVNEIYRETARTILDLNVKNNIRAATTFTAVVYPVLDRAHIVHVGDTRVYLFSGRELAVLTEDHKIPGTSMLTKALGVKVDEPMARSIHINPGDSIVIVSDGVYSIVGEQEIKKMLMSVSNPTMIVSSALATVKTRRGSDDASIGVIKRLA